MHYILNPVDFDVAIAAMSCKSSVFRPKLKVTEEAKLHRGPKKELHKVYSSEID